MAEQPVIPTSNTSRWLRDITEDNFQKGLLRQEYINKGIDIPIGTPIESLSYQQLSSIPRGFAGSFWSGVKSTVLGGTFASEQDMERPEGYWEDLSYGIGHLIGFVADLGLLKGAGKVLGSGLKGAAMAKRVPSWNKTVSGMWKNANPKTRQLLLDKKIVRLYESSPKNMTNLQKQWNYSANTLNPQGWVNNTAGKRASFAVKNQFKDAALKMGAEATVAGNNLYLLGGPVVNALTFGTQLGVRDVFAEGIMAKKFGVRNEAGVTVVQPEDVNWTDVLKAGTMGSQAFFAGQDFNLLKTPMVKGFGAGVMINAGHHLTAALVGPMAKALGFKGRQPGIISDMAFFGALESFDYIGEEEFSRRFSVGALTGLAFSGVAPKLKESVLGKTKPIIQASSKKLVEITDKFLERSKNPKSEKEVENNKKIAEEVEKDDFAYGQREFWANAEKPINVKLADDIKAGKVSAKDVGKTTEGVRTLFGNDIYRKPEAKDSAEKAEAVKNLTDLNPDKNAEALLSDVVDKGFKELEKPTVEKGPTRRERERERNIESWKKRIAEEKAKEKPSERKLKDLEKALQEEIALTTPEGRKREFERLVEKELEETNFYKDKKTFERKPVPENKRITREEAIRIVLRKNSQYVDSPIRFMPKAEYLEYIKKYHGDVRRVIDGKKETWDNYYIRQMHSGKARQAQAAGLTPKEAKSLGYSGISEKELKENKWKDRTKDPQIEEKKAAEDKPLIEEKPRNIELERKAIEEEVKRNKNFHEDTLLTEQELVDRVMEYEKTGNVKDWSRGLVDAYRRTSQRNSEEIKKYIRKKLPEFKLGMEKNLEEVAPRGELWIKEKGSLEKIGFSPKFIKEGMNNWIDKFFDPKNKASEGEPIPNFWEVASIKGYLMESGTKSDWFKHKSKNLAEDYRELVDERFLDIEDMYKETPSGPKPRFTFSDNFAEKPYAKIIKDIKLDAKVGSDVWKETQKIIHKIGDGNIGVSRNILREHIERAYLLAKKDKSNDAKVFMEFLAVRYGRDTFNKEGGLVRVVDAEALDKAAVDFQRYVMLSHLGDHSGAYNYARKKGGEYVEFSEKVAKSYFKNLTNIFESLGKKYTSKELEPYVERIMGEGKLNMDSASARMFQELTRMAVEKVPISEFLKQVKKKFGETKGFEVINLLEKEKSIETLDVFGTEIKPIEDKAPNIPEASLILDKKNFDKAKKGLVEIDGDHLVGRRYVIIEQPSARLTNVEIVDWYKADTPKSEPNKIFIFGDNIARIGKGPASGQAIIRDNKNAFGIATKESPRKFMSDNNLEKNKKVIDSDIAKIKTASKGKTIVFPKGGLGTDRASLKTKAPKTWDYLNKRLEEEFGFINEIGIIDVTDALVKKDAPAVVPRKKAIVESIEMVPLKQSDMGMKNNVVVNKKKHEAWKKENTRRVEKAKQKLRKKFPRLNKTEIQKLANKEGYEFKEVKRKKVVGETPFRKEDKEKLQGRFRKDLTEKLPREEFVVKVLRSADGKTQLRPEGVYIKDFEGKSFFRRHTNYVFSEFENPATIMFKGKKRDLSPKEFVDTILNNMKTQPERGIQEMVSAMFAEGANLKIDGNRLLTGEVTETSPIRDALIGDKVNWGHLLELNLKPEVLRERMINNLGDYGDIFSTSRHYVMDEALSSYEPLGKALREAVNLENSIRKGEKPQEMAEDMKNFVLRNMAELTRDLSKDAAFISKIGRDKGDLTIKEIYDKELPNSMTSKFTRTKMIEKLIKRAEKNINDVDQYHFKRTKSVYEWMKKLQKKKDNLILEDVMEFESDINDIPSLLIEKYLTTPKRMSVREMEKEGKIHHVGRIFIENKGALPAVKHVLEFFKKWRKQKEVKEIPGFMEAWQKQNNTSFTILESEYRKRDGTPNYGVEIYLRESSRDTGSTGPDFRVTTNPRDSRMSARIPVSTTYSIRKHVFRTKTIERAGESPIEGLDVENSGALNSMLEKALKAKKEGNMTVYRARLADIKHMILNTVDGFSNLDNLDVIEKTTKSGNKFADLVINHKSSISCGTCDPITRILRRVRNTARKLMDNGEANTRATKETLRNFKKHGVNFGFQHLDFSREFLKTHREQWTRELTIDMVEPFAQEFHRSKLSEKQFEKQLIEKLHEQYFGRDGTFTTDAMKEKYKGKDWVHEISLEKFTERARHEQLEGIQLQAKYQDSVDKILEWAKKPENAGLKDADLKYLLNDMKKLYQTHLILPKSPDVSEVDFKKQINNWNTFLEAETGKRYYEDLKIEIDDILNNNRNHWSKRKITLSENVGNTSIDNIQTELKNTYLWDKRLERTEWDTKTLWLEELKKYKKTIPTRIKNIEKRRRKAENALAKGYELEEVEINRRKAGAQTALVRDVFHLDRRYNYGWSLRNKQKMLTELNKKFPERFNLLELMNDPISNNRSWYEAFGKSMDNWVAFQRLEEEPVNIMKPKEEGARINSSDVLTAQVSTDAILREGSHKPSYNEGTKMLRILRFLKARKGIIGSTAKKLENTWKKKGIYPAQNFNDAVKILEMLESTGKYKDLAKLKLAEYPMGMTEKSRRKVIIYEGAKDLYERMWRVYDFETMDWYKKAAEWNHGIKRLIMYNPMFHGWNLFINKMSTTRMEGVPKTDKELNDIKKLFEKQFEEHGVLTKINKQKIKDLSLADFSLMSEIFGSMNKETGKKKVGGIEMARRKRWGKESELTMPIDFSRPDYQFMVLQGFPLGEMRDLHMPEFKLDNINKTTGEKWRDTLNRKAGFKVWGEKLRDFNDDVLFQTIAPALEQQTFYRIFNTSLKQIKKEKPNWSEKRQIARAGVLAERYTTTFSGKLHKLDMPKLVDSMGRVLLFANHWTMSNFRILAGMYGMANNMPDDRVTGRMLQHHFVAGVMRWWFYKFLLSQAWNAIVTGGPTWFNEPHRRDKIAVAPNPKGGYYFIDANRFINDLWNFARPSGFTGAGLGYLVGKGLPIAGSRTIGALAGITAFGALGASISKPVSDNMNKWAGLPNTENYAIPQMETLWRKLNPSVKLPFMMMDNSDPWKTKKIVSGDHHWTQQMKELLATSIVQLTPINNGNIITDNEAWSKMFSFENIDPGALTGAALGFWVSGSRKKGSYIVRQSNLESEYRWNVKQVMTSTYLSQEAKKKRIEFLRKRYKLNSKKLREELNEYLEAYKKEGEKTRYE